MSLKGGQYSLNQFSTRLESSNSFELFEVRFVLSLNDDGESNVL